MRFFATGCLAFVGILLPGCGPKYFPVEGKVVWADDTPAKELEGSQVVFDSSELKISARGTIGADGTFTITTINPDDGVLAGNYKVAIVEERKPVRKDDWSQVHPALLDAKYANHQSSGLTAQVTSGKNQIKLVVERLKRK